MLASEGVPLPSTMEIKTGANTAQYSAQLLGIQDVIRSNLTSHSFSCVKIGKD